MKNNKSIALSESISHLISIFEKSGHKVIYGITEYGNGYSRKIRVLTINNDPVIGQFVDEITSIVARVCGFSLNKKGQIYFRGGSDINDIAYTIEQKTGIKLNTRRL
jgi:hypothetical protein